MKTSPFKAYDIRGRVGETLTTDLMRDVGQAFAGQVAQAGPVVVGFDARDSSPVLAEAVIEGLGIGGSDVLELGMCGTEEVYFATDHLGASGGLMVTASHNPMGDNGLKLVAAGARPVGQDTGLGQIEALCRSGRQPSASRRGARHLVDARPAYVARVLSFIDPAALAPLKVLVNAGNGAAGPTFDALAAALNSAGAPVTFERLHHDPDPTFPNGIPNPLLPENHPVTAKKVVDIGADIGVAWDGDFDRCFFFDADGCFVDGVYLVGLLAQAALRRSPGDTIIYEPRAVFSTRDAVADAGGRAVMGRTGHSFMKASMRAENAAYGGEISAHHYFRDFMYCDSGIIPMLLILDEISRSGQSLSELVAARIAAYPVSGEQNFRLANPEAALQAVEARYATAATHRDDTDGLSLEFADWRFNLRRSNTEPLVRLNVEARGDARRVTAETQAIAALLNQAGA
ncbi:MAG: phosphomannomutase [Pseudomonadota bacterium]